MKEFKGKLAGFPEEVVEKMLERQVEQGNDRNVKVFEDYVHIGVYGGFDWCKTVEGRGFWVSVIEDKNFNLFFDKYPKAMPESKYPKVMMVSDKPICESNKGHRRVVFMEKCDKFVAWSNAETIEESESVTDTASWTHAEEVPTILTVTLLQVAEKFGVPACGIKIVE